VRLFSSAAGTQVTTLPNGFKVVTEQTYGQTGTSTVGLHVDTGSRFESERTNGVAHFLEHMSFKGTSKRTRQALEKEVEDMGGHLNAYTSRETTVFYTKCFDSDMSQAMDIISDITQNSLYRTEDVEAERSVITREMEEVNANNEEVIFDILHYTAYRGTSLGRTILGPVENINSIQQQDIKEFVTKHYTAPRMVLAAAGSNIDHGKIVQLATQYFGNVPSAPAGGLTVVKEPAVFTGSSMTITNDDYPSAHVAYGFPTTGWNDPDSIVLMLLQVLIGSWNKGQKNGSISSSPLIAELAGTAQSLSAFNTQYSDTGLFGVYFTANQAQVYDSSIEVARFMTSLCYNVDQALVDEAKNRLKIFYLNQNDGSTATCEEAGRQVLTLGRRISTDEAFARIDAIDTAAVKACANRFFYDRDFALAANGPIHELPDYNELRRKTYWLMF